MGKLINKLKKYHMGQEIILLGFIVVLIIIISLVSGKAYSFESFLDTLKSSSPYMIWAVGVLLVMLSGGIDISFSSIAAVTAYLTLFYQNNTGRGNLFLSILIAGLMGLCLGLFNATLISIFDLPAMIVTLATSNIFFGALLNSVPTAHLNKVPSWISKFGASRIFTLTNKAGNPYGLSSMAFTAIVIMVIFAILLKYTSLGRNIYALGSSREAARRAGISIVKTQFAIYMTVGFLSGIASILSASMISYVQPFNIQGVTMDVIAAVVLGGASLTGGKGSIFGSFLGVLLIFLIKNSLVQLGIPSEWDSVLVGSVLIISIGITMLKSDKR